MILEGEDEREFRVLLDEIWDEYNPQGPLMEELADRLAETLWRFRRGKNFEAAILNWKRNYHREEDQHKRALRKHVHFMAPDVSHLNATELTLGRALDEVLTKGDHLGKLGRHEAHLMRQIQRIVDQLEKAKRERQALQCPLPQQATAGPGPVQAELASTPTLPASSTRTLPEGETVGTLLHKVILQFKEAAQNGIREIEAGETQQKP